MANRTFKVYGQAYAASGDVNVTMTVGGTQVFSGAVNDSTTVRDGQPTVENHLWTYEMDENTVGDLAVSIAVTNGELCLGPTEHNLIKTKILSDEWLATHTSWTLEEQQYMATQIGQTFLDAEQAGLYDLLMAGNASAETTGDAISRALFNGPRSTENFVPVNDIRANLKINDNADHASVVKASELEEKALWWPILQDGDTLTYTWTFDPDSDAF